MEILKKHKKNGEDGFSNFIRNLETMSPSKRRDIILISSLEDPVYMSWILRNILSIDFVLRISRDEFKLLFMELNQDIQYFIRAFHGSVYEARLLENILPEGLVAKYTEEIPYVGEVTKEINSACQNKILIKLRNFLDNRRIRGPGVDLPSKDILQGKQDTPRSGKFKMFYEDGCTALFGQFEERLREGEWQHYYPQNALMARGFYHAGAKVDDWTFWYPNKKLWASGRYKDNLRTGKWKLHERDDRVRDVEYFRGKIV